MLHASHAKNKIFIHDYRSVKCRYNFEITKLKKIETKELKQRTEQAFYD